MKLCVVGVPLSQGSKYARVVKGRAIMTDGFGESARNLQSWRRAIADEAGRWMLEHDLPAPFDGPLVLSIVFYLPRPASAPKSRLFPDGKPDLSKLIRAVEDALSKVAYADDARIVKFDNPRKLYAIASPPRVEIELRRATDADL